MKNYENTHFKHKQKIFQMSLIELTKMGVDPEAYLWMLKGNDFQKARIYDIQDKFDFGKYPGHTVKFVVESNPGYIIWCVFKTNWFFITSDVVKTLATHLFRIERVEGTFDLFHRKLCKQLRTKICDDFDEFDEWWNRIYESRLQEEENAENYKEIIFGGYADITGGEMDFDTWLEIQ
jgi:hypothetical protein